jgi:hypothetical protein
MAKNYTKKISVLVTEEMKEFSYWLKLEKEKNISQVIRNFLIQTKEFREFKEEKKKERKE